MPCPTGRKALANEPVFANDPHFARQPTVSGPKIDEMTVMMRAGKWNWTGREIERNGDVIIEGHHRYIAARLAKIEPVFIKSNVPVVRKFRWTELIVAADRWSGGY